MVRRGNVIRKSCKYQQKKLVYHRLSDSLLASICKRNRIYEIFLGQTLDIGYVRFFYFESVLQKQDYHWAEQSICLQLIF